MYMPFQSPFQEVMVLGHSVHEGVEVFHASNGLLEDLLWNDAWEQ